LSPFIDGILALWYLLTAGSVVFLVWDFSTNTPTTKIMKLAWTLVVLYTGPVGFFLYILSCRQPLPTTHSVFISAHWKQAVGSLLHCVAGDATGVIISAAIVSQFGLPNGLDLIIEYLFAFIVGLLVFQALFMIAMYGGNYWLAVRKTFFAETISMNMVMTGMIPTMVILMHALPGANKPEHALFWGVMSVATMVGMITAYPINSWLVAKGLKHGMMSAIPEPESKDRMSMAPGTAQKEPPEAGHHDHHVSALSGFQAALILSGTFAVMLLSLWLTAQYVPISFTLGG